WFGGVNMLTNLGNVFVGTFSGDGSALTGLNLSNLCTEIGRASCRERGDDTAAVAPANLGAAGSGANSDITTLSGLSTPLSIVQGGTGADTESNALGNLGGAALMDSNWFAGVNMLTNLGNAFVGSFSGDGSALTGLNLSNLCT